MENPVNKKRNQQTLSLVIVTTLTVITWIGFQIFNSLTSTKVKPEIRQYLTPLNPDLETEMVEKIRGTIQPETEALRFFGSATASGSAVAISETEVAPEASPAGRSERGT